MRQMLSMQGSWSNRWVFILAAMGSSVGLGNIWLFPIMVGQYGGGAFILLYLCCMLLVAVPIMMAEVVIGRHARQNPVNAIEGAAVSAGASRHWRLVGVLAIFCGFLIFSYYSVVAGWVLHYLVAMIFGQLNGLGVDQTSRFFNALLADSQMLLLWHSLFVLLVIWVLAQRVERGLDRAMRFLMPVLFLMLFMLLGFALTTGEFVPATEYLFNFHLQDIGWDAVLIALGHSFFTLALGVGVIMAYSAYMGKGDAIAPTVIAIGVFDTLVAMLIGLVVVTVVMAAQMELRSGPGLLFVTLPVAFTQLPGGQVFGFLFFLLAAVAALTSAISLLEPATAWLTERFRWSRARAVSLLGVLAWGLGVAALYSLGQLPDLKLLGVSIFDLIDITTTILFLPLGGIAVAVLAGWVLDKEVLTAELALSSPSLASLWLWLLRFIAPSAVGLIFVMNLYNALYS